VKVPNNPSSCRNQPSLLLKLGNYKAKAVLDLEVIRYDQGGGKERLPLAFGFEHKRMKHLGDTEIAGQIGGELLALALQDYQKFGWKKKVNKTSAYVVEVRGYNFGFWKAEFATQTIQSLHWGKKPLEKTVLAVSRPRKGFGAKSGWNFTIPEERNTVIYALQSLIDHFNNYK